jgi:hypothetical protein
LNDISSFYLYLEPLSSFTLTCPKASLGFSCYGYDIQVVATHTFVGWEGCIDAPSSALYSSLQFSAASASSYSALSSTSYADDYCSWEGVTCDSATSELTGLDLSTWGFKGSIPSAITLLTELQSLNLAYNKLSGTFPRLKDMTRLVKIRFQGNSLSGTVPNTLSNIGLLTNSDPSVQKEFDISFNRLEGTLNDFYCEYIQPNTYIGLTSSGLDCYHQCWDNLTSIGVDFSENSISACAPSYSPTSVPSPHPTFKPKKASKNHNLLSFVEILVISLVIPTLCCLAAYGTYRLFSSSANRARTLARLPIHKALIEQLPTEEVLSNVKENLDTALIRDYDGFRAIDYAIQYEVDDDIIYELVVPFLPFYPNGSPVEPDYHNFVWVEINHYDSCANVVERILNDFPAIALNLIYAEDEHDRKVINMATKECKQKMLDFLYLFKRYEITTANRPHHQSDTSLLHFAIERETKNRVALKFLNQKEHFLREVENRKSVHLSPEFVIDVIETYDIDSDENIKREIKRKGFSAFPYVTVMPAADRNLQSIIANEAIAGQDWDRIRFIAIDILNAMDHFHKQGIVHCDIKPLNIMRIDNKIKLIDLDASAKIDEAFIGFKYSSAYIPPEMIFFDGKHYKVKAYDVDSAGHPIVHGLPYQLVKAHPSQDVWEFGIVLYELCTGVKVFIANNQDNIIDDNTMGQLYDFNDSFKNDYLLARLDENLMAKNLLSQILTKDPRKRPPISQILAHPFLSGKAVTRCCNNNINSCHCRINIIIRKMCNG